MTVLQLLPHHTAELLGRSGRNLEKFRTMDGADIEIYSSSSAVTILASEAAIAKVTVCAV